MTLSMPLFESALAHCLVQALWQDALLGAAAALALSLTVRRSAATRHVIGLGFLTAMLAVPTCDLAVALAGGGASAVGSFGHTAASILFGPTGGLLAPAVATAVSPNLEPPVWLAWVWAGGALAMFVRLAGGAWLLRSLARQPSAPLSPAWAARLEALRVALRIVRPVTVKVLAAIEQPFSSNACRPVIWLPVSMLTRLAPDQIEALLAHELAHIRRLDWIWNGLQCTIEALLFFHPAVWWLSFRIRQEREHACDDLAVAVCGDPIVVAEALASLEALRQPLPQLVLAADGGSLIQRVRRLLGTSRPPRIRWTVAAGFAVLTSAAGLVATRSSIAADTAAPPPAVTAIPASPAPATAAPPAASQPAATVSGEPWWTYVGDSVRIKGTDHGHARDYHAWVDLKGKQHETYRVDGKPAAIDADVRQWVAEHHSMPAPPLPPTPPPPQIPPLPAVPAVPPAPPAPPVPAAPPSPPDVASSAAFQALVQQLPNDAEALVS